MTVALAYPFYHAPPSSPCEVTASEIAPDRIIGMDKIVVASGEKALQLVKQSHAGSIEHVKDVAILHYMKGGGKYLTLWLTIYPDATIAKNETEKMAEGMRNWGGSWASNLREVTISDKKKCIEPRQITYRTISGRTESGYFILYHIISRRQK